MAAKYLIFGPITQSTVSDLIVKIEEKTDTGAHSIFLGQVRSDEIEGKKVKAIEYSAYEKMVEVEADKIKRTIFSEFREVSSIDIIHSTGFVKAGEISLIVIVSAHHRHQAIQACSNTVEMIKEKLPVWKNEIFEDNSHKWK